MGWTVFACFGHTNKRKRPKTHSKFGFTSRRRIRGYEPLQPDVLQEQDASEPRSSTRENPKDDRRARIGKKVRFNLEVVAYEPLSSQDDEDDNYLEGGSEGQGTEQAATAGACLVYAPLSKTITTDPSYRYNNCYDGEDEYDEDDDNDSEFSDGDDVTDDDHELLDFQNIYCEGISKEIRDSSSKPVTCSATNARLRSHYIAPVLNPIENLSQWKAVKKRKC